MGTREKYWDDGRIGGSAVSFRIKEGWLEIHHGATKDGRYCLGAVLLTSGRFLCPVIYLKVLEFAAMYPNDNPLHKYPHNLEYYRVPILKLPQSQRIGLFQF